MLLKESRGMWDLKGSIVYRMVGVLMLLLGLLPHVVCKVCLSYPNKKAPCIKHHVRDPLPISHEFHQPGDFVIGMLLSHVFFVEHPTNFREQPSQMLKQKVM